MSLISEALRKARQQAAEEDDQQRGRYSWSPAAHPRGTRLGLGLALGALIALAAALAGAGAVWWLVGHRADSEPAAESSLPGAAPSVEGSESRAPADPLQEVGEPHKPSPPAVDELRSGEDREPPPRQIEEPTAEPVREARTDNPPTQVPSTPAAGRADATPPSVSPAPVQTATVTIGPDGERIYLIEADLGTVVLTLDFIALRADDPFAQINGLDVHVGSTIEGFTVEAIERDQVRLRDDDGPLILRAP